MAGIKSSVRIMGVALWVAGFAAACSQLLGDVLVDGVAVDSTEVNPILPDAGGPAPLPIICEDGQTRCDGPLLQRCIDGGRAWLTTNVCPTEALCQATDGSSVSQCLPAICAVEQMSCDGPNLLLCDKGRNGWVGFDACESNAHCDATARTCLNVPCESGQLRCNIGKLERCNDLRTDWELVDECETNELCEVTRTRAADGTLVPGPGLEGQPGAGTPLAPGAAPPLACVTPTCVPGERRCTGDRLEFCNEGRTDWELAQTCATPILCENSLTYAGTGERPRCVRAACAVNEHECTTGGVLEVCDDGRDRFRAIETCIGPPFCNSVQADQGGPGCLDAPCVAGQMQCNGPQRQVCRADRTGFDPVGAPCETRDLCNDDNPTAAVCRPPVCQQGPLSATEFRCQGALLERCNDQHTGYDSFAQCETAGLCNAGFGFEGCRPPVCAVGERRCQGDFVQLCNEQRTAFVNFERCAAGTCDSVAGSCATPCELGSRRCNNQGQVEECRDRLVGREITARCASPQLCNGATGTCTEPPQGCTVDGLRRCRVQGANTVLEECRDGRSRFVTLDTCSAAASEICDPADVLCDVCPQGSQAVCQGTSVVACAANGQNTIPTACQFGCVAIAGAPDRCRDCNLGGAGTCSGNVLTTCAADADLTGQIRNNACTSAGACQTELTDCNRDGDGRDCSCTPCNAGQTGCNGAQPTICRDPQQGLVANGGACRSAEHCDGDGGGCFECIRGELTCQNSQIRICNNSTNTFDPPGGRIQCIEGNSVALICGNSGSPVRDECDEDEFCDPRFGCVSCVPGSIDCSGDDRVVCSADGSGFGMPQACDTTSTCRAPGTCGAGACVAGAVSPGGTGCTRVGNAAGFCDGTQCLECLPDGNANQRRCDDGIGCTGDSCLVSSCVHAPNNGACANDEVCDGTETCSVTQGCVDGPDAPDEQVCTQDNGTRGACNDGDCVCQAGSARCNGQVLTRCVASGVEQPATCQGARRCFGPDVCSAASGGSCQPQPLSNTACTRDGGGAGQCQNGVCGCVPGATCSGATLTVCSANGTEAVRICGEGEDQCRGPQICSTADGGDCLEGRILEGDTCTQPSGALGACRANGTCGPIQRCPPGRVTCSGQTLSQCSDDGAVETITTCNAAVGCIGPQTCSTLDEGSCQPAQPLDRGATCGANGQGQCDGSGNCCGDGVCSDNESCAADCTPAPVCGNERIEEGETCELPLQACPPRNTDGRECIRCQLTGACQPIIDIDIDIDPIPGIPTLPAQ